MKRVAIVTGGSGGIGRCTAAELKKAGCTVYEFSRREKPAEGIIHLTADMTDEAQVKAAVEEVLRREGRIDILVNNAGFGISGAAETTDTKDAHAQLELNLYGMDNATKAVLPAMRSQGSGRILCMSSIAGILPIPFQLWYSVSKAAINAYVLPPALPTRARNPPPGTTYTPGGSSAPWPSWKRTSAAACPPHMPGHTWPKWRLRPAASRWWPWGPPIKAPPSWPSFSPAGCPTGSSA